MIASFFSGVGGLELGLKQAIEAQRLWPTPTAVRGNENKHYKLWPTPTAGDSNASGSAGYSTKSGRHSGTTLTDAIVRFPTPTARDHKDTGDCANVPVNGLLGRAIGPSKAQGSLNPEFVEWLMGFPRGHTALGPQESGQERLESPKA